MHIAKLAVVGISAYVGWLSRGACVHVAKLQLRMQ